MVIVHRTLECSLLVIYVFDGIALHLDTRCRAMYACTFFYIFNNSSLFCRNNFVLRLLSHNILQSFIFICCRLVLISFCQVSFFSKCNSIINFGLNRNRSVLDEDLWPCRFLGGDKFCLVNCDFPCSSSLFKEILVIL